MRDHAEALMLVKAASRNSSVWRYGMAILALSDERMFWATILSPRCRVAANGDDFSFTIGRGYYAKFSHVAIGGVGRIIWSSIEENAVDPSCLQFRGGHAVRSLRKITIEKAAF